MLRAPAARDAADLAAGVGDRRVSRWLLHVPHPYPPALARAWIAQAATDARAGTAATWVIEEAGAVIGVVSLRLVARHRHAELGYWVARRAWGRGVATEATRAAVAWAFAAWRAERVFAQTLGEHPASARVLGRLGMRPEGVRRRHLRKGARYHDAHQFGVVRAAWRDAVGHNARPDVAARSDRALPRARPRGGGRPRRAAARGRPAR